MAGLSYGLCWVRWCEPHGQWLQYLCFNASSKGYLHSQKTQHSEERFSAIKDTNIRVVSQGDAWRLARHHKNHVQEKIFTQEQKVEVLREVIVKVLDYGRKHLFSQGQIEALIHGNFSASDAVNAARSVKKQLKVRYFQRRTAIRKEASCRPGETLLSTNKLDEQLRFLA